MESQDPFVLATAPRTGLSDAMYIVVGIYSMMLPSGLVDDSYRTPADFF
jgi:hypothetical protein